jgi:predicted NBD/HSP70 family sugar kinase
MDSSRSVGNTVFQKKANEALVLSVLRHRGSCSRLELADATGLRQSTVTYIVDRLLDRKIVKSTESPLPSGKRGQQPIPLAIDSSFGCVLGIDICKGTCRFAISDIVGTILRSGNIALDEKLPFSERFRECQRAVRVEAKKLGLKVIAVGLSVSGVVDTAGGIIKRSWAERLVNYDIGEELSPGLRVPLIVENDAKCCASAKLWEANGSPEADTFLYVFIRSSVDSSLENGGLPLSLCMGLVVNGAVYRGVSDYAGEFRSAFPTRSGMSQLSLSNEELKSFNKDRAVTRKVVDEIVSNLVPLIILLNPSRLFIGGDISADPEWIASAVEEDLQLQRHLPQIGDCAVTISQTAQLDPAYGACASVLSAIYAIPAIGQRTPRADLSWDALLS